jgi:1-acyl-sn-glycerol-3-phosphate acyltransferase
MMIKHSDTKTEINKVSPEDLLDVIQGLIEETPQEARFRGTLNLDTHLDRDLGLGSLARSELLARINQTFGILMQDEALLAETPQELLVFATQAAGLPGVQEPMSRTQLPRGRSALPSETSTLVEVLAWYCGQRPQRQHLLYYGNNDDPEAISYQDLWQGAVRIAKGLWEYGVLPGDRVALMLPTGKCYFFSFFGILMVGAVPVPIYPPARLSQLEEHLRRHGRILQNAQVSLLITFSEASKAAHLLKTQAPSLRYIADWMELGKTADDFTPVAREGDDIAFLQYTSGSTGDPKGVVLTHTHLLANIRAMGEAVEVTPDDVFISWLPLYHDMGLIGAWLGSLYFGLPLVVMSPLRFLARPSRWLWAIDRHRGTLSASPNFGYELCLSKVPDHEVVGLDLSSWRRAFNGAEPVSATTLQQFTERYASHGLSAHALAPVYGLAEATVGLAFPPPTRGPLIDRVNRNHFMLSGEAIPAPEGDPNPLSTVSCGRPLPGYQLQVVDDANRVLPERKEGRLEFRGPSATCGYFKNRQATTNLFRDGWLDTGDRGYIADGELYLTGRIKEMVIRGGRNIYPYELEQRVGELPEIRKGCVVIFPSDDPKTGSERLVVVAESRESNPERQASIRQAIRKQTIDLLGMPPDDVVVVSPHTVLKTSSGKLRRGTMRMRYEQGQLGRGARWLPLQILNLVLSGMGQRLRSICHNLTHYLFAAYASALFYILVPLVWCSVVLLPRLSWRWRAIRLAIRILRLFTGTPLRVVGLERLPVHDKPYILVVNHSSYLDTLALIDAIPRDFAYVAKHELSEKFHSRVFLQRLGTQFVERFNTRRGAVATDEFVSRLASGQSLVFYPEGTFRAEPGLLPFHMGAFVAAVRGDVPIVPVTLCGTRTILPSNSKWPRHGAIEVTIEYPLKPEGNDWASAVHLQTEAQALIARHYNEQIGVSKGR